MAAIALQLPVVASEAARAWAVAQAWPDHARQYRLIAEGVPMDLLRAAEGIPDDATVLLVTPGTDVRGREYRTFHRALYFLAPRPVHWVTPAPSDGTWESRSWRSVPGLPAATCAEAARVAATHLLLVDMPPPATACGTIVRPEPTDSPVSSAPWWRLIVGSVLALLVPLALGWAIVERLARGATLHAGQRAAAAWAVGTGVVTLGHTLLGLGGLGPVVRYGLLTAAVALGVPLLARASSRSLPPLRALVPAAAVTPFVALVALLSVGVPWTVWDGWAIWGMKARTLFAEGGLTTALLADPTRTSTHPGYPLNVPALEAWLFNWIVTPDDRLVGLLGVATFAALLAVVYGTLRRFGTDKWLATASVAALASLYLVWRSAAAGFADVPLALLATVAAVLLIEWLRNGHAGVLALSALAGGLMPWTKMEGAVLLMVIAALSVAAGVLAREPVARRRGIAGAAALIGAGIALSGWWWALVAVSGAPSADYRLGVSALLENVGRLPAIASLELQMLAALGWSFFWPAAAAVGLAWLLVRRRRPGVARLAGRVWLLPVAAATYLLLMSAAYVVTTFEPFTQQIESSAFRLALHVLPVAFIWTVLAADDLTA